MLAETARYPGTQTRGGRPCKDAIKQYLELPYILSFEDGQKRAEFEEPLALDASHFDATRIRKTQRREAAGLLSPLNEPPTLEAIE